MGRMVQCPTNWRSWPPEAGALPGSAAAGADEHLSVALPTALGQLRNALLVNVADGVVAVGGGWGPLGL